VRGRRIGALMATSALTSRFSAEQGRLLALAGERCARGLASAEAYERERRTSAALQGGLLPQSVPELRHGEIAVRYLPARDGPAVGGDWYDAVLLPDGRVGVAVGDVPGQGAEAAALMSQMRAALRAYALEGSPPAVVAQRLNTLAMTLGGSAVATLVYALFDADLERATFVNAGHPPPILVSGDGARAIGDGVSAPAGRSAGAEFQECELPLTPGDALCLYSNGLDKAQAADRAAREQALLAALGTPAGAEILCERALAALRPAGADDEDLALLVLRTSATAEGFKATYSATPGALSEARGALRDWMSQLGATRNDTDHMLVACGEACMNAVEHAYAGAGDGGTFTLEGHLDGKTVVIIVRDAGRWSEVRSRGHGRGLKLMEALMDSVQLSFSVEGTVVVLRKTLGPAA
jgi:serine phosphatase RsbU (regulator of sigma subunit)/anti-sigma regulatory factor (Ser/Thr protein kinase)